MSDVQSDSDVLVRAFAARSKTPAALNQCPDSELLFEAASGALERDQRLEIVDHVSQCAQCAMAWRLAMELGARPAAPPAVRASTSWMPRLALAASVLAAVGLSVYFLIPVSDQQPQYRNAADPLAPSSLTAGTLPRDRFLLQWSPGPPGSSYTLRLSTADLNLLFLEKDLTTAGMLVPASALESVESGQPLLWQVEIHLPDGQRVQSETYVVTLDRGGLE